MIVLRCTTKLLGRLAVAPLDAPGASTSRLGDWYASLLHTRRGQFVLAIARETLLPIVVAGRDLRTFPVRLAHTLAAVLAAYGVPSDTIEQECAAMSDVHYARTDDRSTVGVLIELVRQLSYHVEDDPDLELTRVSLQLAETPIVARHLIPDLATCSLFGVADRYGRRH